MAASPSAVNFFQTHEPDLMFLSVLSIANRLSTNYLYTVNVCIAYIEPPGKLILRRDLTFLYTSTYILILVDSVENNNAMIKISLSVQ